MLSPLLMLNQETRCLVSPPVLHHVLRRDSGALHRVSTEFQLAVIGPLLVFAHAAGGGEGVLNPFPTENWHLLSAAGACVLCDILSGNLHVRPVSLIVVSATEWGGDFHGLEQRDMPDRRVLRWVFLRICSSLLLPRARPRLATVPAASRVHRGGHRRKGTAIRALQGCIGCLGRGARQELGGITRP